MVTTKQRLLYILIYNMSYDMKQMMSLNDKYLNASTFPAKLFSLIKVHFPRDVYF